MKTFLLALLIVGITALPTQAAFIFPGVVNEWEDVDFETFFDANHSGTADVGDFFAGMWQVSTVRNTATNATVNDPNIITYTAIFLLKVVGNDVPGFDGGVARPVEYVFAPTGATEDLTLLGGGATDDPWAVLLGQTRSSTNTMAQIYEDSTPPAIQDLIPGNSSILDEIAARCRRYAVV